MFLYLKVNVCAVNSVSVNPPDTLNTKPPGPVEPVTAPLRISSPIYAATVPSLTVVPSTSILRENVAVLTVLVVWAGKGPVSTPPPPPPPPLSSVAVSTVAAIAFPMLSPGPASIVGLQIYV